MKSLILCLALALNYKPIPIPPTIELVSQEQILAVKTNANGRQIAVPNFFTNSIWILDRYENKMGELIVHELVHFLQFYNRTLYVQRHGRTVISRLAEPEAEYAQRNLLHCWSEK